MNNDYQFYLGRIAAAPAYGFSAGHDIIKTVSRCAFADSQLTDEEFINIMNSCILAHRKMMEDNYNDGWNE